MSNSAFQQRQTGNASETAAGSVEIATQAQIDAGTDVGETGAPLTLVPSRVPKTLTKISATTFDPGLDGSVTPYAVGIGGDGRFFGADANDMRRNKFSGFLKSATSGQLAASFLNGQTQTTATTFSHTVNAGNNRIIILQIQLFGSVTLPTGVTWNSIAMTKLTDFRYANTIGSAGASIWYLAVGSNASSDTANIVITGSVGVSSSIISNYQDVDQTTPVAFWEEYHGSNKATNYLRVTPTQSRSLVINHILAGTAISTIDSKFPERYSVGTTHKLCDAVIVDTDDIIATTVVGAPTNDLFTQVLTGLKNASQSAAVDIHISGVVDGFTGLTVGSEYYLSTTAGGITATPGGQFVGIARTTTSIEIPNVQKKTGINVQEFTSTGTWHKPNFGTFAYIELWGGGGSGAAVRSGSPTAAGGGGGGQYRCEFVPMSVLEPSVTVTIGAGGAGVGSSGAVLANGNPGGTTSFGSQVSAAGGGGGTYYSGSGGTGQGGTGGSTGVTSFGAIMNESGTNGAGATVASGSGSAGPVTNTKMAGAGGGAGSAPTTVGPYFSGGGASLFGGNGGRGKGGGPNPTGTPGEFPGGGGGGGATQDTSGGAYGGAGAGGYCRVTVF